MDSPNDQTQTPEVLLYTFSHVFGTSCVCARKEPPVMGKPSKLNPGHAEFRRSEEVNSTPLIRLNLRLRGRTLKRVADFQSLREVGLCRRSQSRMAQTNRSFSLRLCANSGNGNACANSGRGNAGGKLFDSSDFQVSGSLGSLLPQRA